MQTNLAVVALPNVRKTIRAIDVPGHPRIRDQFKDYLPEAKAVAFIVDASTVSRNGAAVAELVLWFFDKHIRLTFMIDTFTTFFTH